MYALLRGDALSSRLDLSLFEYAEHLPSTGTLDRLL